MIDRSCVLPENNLGRSSRSHMFGHETGNRRHTLLYMWTRRSTEPRTRAQDTQSPRYTTYTHTHTRTNAHTRTHTHLCTICYLFHKIFIAGKSAVCVRISASVCMCVCLTAPLVSDLHTLSLRAGGWGYCRTADEPRTRHHSWCCTEPRRTMESILRFYTHTHT